MMVKGEGKFGEPWYVLLKGNVTILLQLTCAYGVYRVCMKLN